MTNPSRTPEAAQNNDREIWREREGDYYADSIHVTERGGIGINCGGRVFVMPVRHWHALAADSLGEAASAGVSPDLKDEVLLKAIKLLEALSEPCTEVGGADHSWRLCRRCMAIRQFDFAPDVTRVLVDRVLARLLGEAQSPPPASTCCCRKHTNGDRCIECPVHGIAPPASGGVSRASIEALIAKWRREARGPSLAGGKAVNIALELAMEETLKQCADELAALLTAQTQEPTT